MDKDEEGKSITKKSGEDIEQQNANPNANAWYSSGSKWKDYLYFCGPGWFVAIAYIDPGNTQADIQAGAVSGFYQLWTFLWVTVLSIYVQVLCARLAMVGQTTLAESMKKVLKHKPLILIAWIIAEFSVIITDLPEVIGIGIAFNVFFGWPYWVGVLISPVTTMLFLATQNMKFGMRVLEGVIVLLVGIMSVMIFVEWGLVGDNPKAAIEGIVYGFVSPKGRDLWVITGIIGAVVMPHNLYLHTASVLSRPVRRDDETIKQATYWVSVEPVVPIMFSFFINIGIVIIAATNVFGTPNAANVGNSDFEYYLRGPGPVLWGLALLAAGQSSAITTTYSGQYVMEGFLEMRIPLAVRAIVTRCIALIPCVAIAAAFPGEPGEGSPALNQIINIVNSSLSILLPFALIPLCRLTCSKDYLGEYAAKGIEKWIIGAGGFLVWAINAMSLSTPGGGFFGDLMIGVTQTLTDGTTFQMQTAMTVQYNIWNDVVQVFTLLYMLYFIFVPITEPCRDIYDPRPVEEEGTFGVVQMFGEKKESAEENEPLVAANGGEDDNIKDDASNEIET